MNSVFWKEKKEFFKVFARVLVKLNFLSPEKKYERKQFFGKN